MRDIATITELEILSDEIFDELFDVEDPIARDKRKAELREFAKKCGKAGAFDSRCRVYEKMLKEVAQKEAREKQKAILNVVHLTDFSDLPEKYSQLPCGTWNADDAGVRTYSKDAEVMWACQHPILPVERMKNLQTGLEQMKIAYKRDGKWQEHIFPKNIISSSNKIVGLSDYGIIVTTESAKLLVRYLSDVEALSGQCIDLQFSSGKFGWVHGIFLPYDASIRFDAGWRFLQLESSIQSHGDYEVWLEMVRRLRRQGSFPVRMMMAASFASVLLELVDALPFFVDLWGDTEGGKTVTLMLACSIWANPSENQYMGDFRNTDVGLEVKANALNNLPLILDDTSRISERIRDNFEGFIYDMASGKGKTRSDKELGIRYENNWRLTILTNGEAPLNAYANQGGAINRILEVKAGKVLFEDPREVLDIIRKNYGFAGKKFVEVVKKIDQEELKKMLQEKRGQLEGAVGEKMQKQAISLAVILLADQIAADEIFKDDLYINVEEAAQVLIAPDELSVNERAYRFLLDKISMNESRFDPENDHVEQWGVMDSDYAYFYPAAFDALCKQGSFSKKSFIDWAIKREKIATDSRGYPSKTKRMGATAKKYLWLKLETEEKEAFFD